MVCISQIFVVESYVLTREYISPRLKIVGAPDIERQRAEGFDAEDIPSDHTIIKCALAILRQ